MITIYKYPLEAATEQFITVPKNAKLLSVISQEYNIVAYFKVDTDDKETHKKYFAIFGTGHDCKLSNNLRFVNTVKLKDYLIFHIFTEYEVNDDQ